MHQMYRCLMLQDLGQYDEAARACARMRTLTRKNYWGAFVTSWLEYGRGDLLEALRWSAEAARLEPGQAAPLRSTASTDAHAETGRAGARSAESYRDD